MFNCSIYSFTLSLGLKVLTHGPDIEGGTVDPKIKGRDLCLAFTKACEKFKKIQQVYEVICDIWGAQGEEPKQTYVKESFEEEVLS